MTCSSGNTHPGVQHTPRGAIWLQTCGRRVHETLTSVRVSDLSSDKVEDRISTPWGRSFSQLSFESVTGSVDAGRFHFERMHGWYGGCSYSLATSLCLTGCGCTVFSCCYFKRTVCFKLAAILGWTWLHSYLYLSFAGP